MIRVISPLHNKGLFCGRQGCLLRALGEHVHLYPTFNKPWSWDHMKVSDLTGN